MEIEYLMLIVFLGLLVVLFIFWKSRPQAEWKINVTKKLGVLDELLSSNDVHKMQTALFEADKLMDFTLKNLKIKGETMGERLKAARHLFEWSDYQKIWEAHKLRNKLAHEIGFTPFTNELQTHYQNLKKQILRKVAP